MSFFLLSETVFMSNLTHTIKDSSTQSNCGSVEFIKKKNKKAKVDMIITETNFQSKCSGCSFGRCLLMQIKWKMK